MVDFSTGVAFTVASLFLSYSVRYFFNKSISENASLVRWTKLNAAGGNGLIPDYRRISDGFLFVPVASIIAFIVPFVLSVRIVLNNPELFDYRIVERLGAWKVLSEGLSISLSFILLVVLACVGLHVSLRYLQSDLEENQWQYRLWKRGLNLLASIMLTMTVLLIFILPKL